MFWIIGGGFLLGICYLLFFSMFYLATRADRKMLMSKKIEILPIHAHRKKQFSNISGRPKRDKVRVFVATQSVQDLSSSDGKLEIA